MTPEDASRILARLKAAFPVMTLDEEQADLLLEQCALLSDASVLDEAVGYLIQREERFPPIARIRLAYRSVSDARQAAARALEPQTKRGEGAVLAGVPEWIHVWCWQLNRTRAKRQSMAYEKRGRSRAEPHEVAPVKMRDFPQFENPGSDAYSVDEYEKIRRGWERAGSPHAGSPADIVAGAVG